ncbi:MAG: DUF3048 domain-containing protein [Enterocloster clostridioformis]
MIAVYVHYGQSTFAKPYLKNVDNINRSGCRRRSGLLPRKGQEITPANAYTSGGGITASIEKLGYTRSYAPSYRCHYLFARTAGEASS